MKIPTDYHRRLHDFEPIDDIRIEIVPRYKTSGMSGDEWRQSVKVVGLFKGLEVFKFWAGSMKAAMAMLPGKVLELGDQGLGSVDLFLKTEQESCDQPSCPNTPVTKYRLKRLTSRSGEYLDPADQSFTYWRKFCAAHSRRGDCSREDADDNYEVIEGPGPGAVDPDCVRPSQSVVVDVGSIENVPKAVKEVVDRERSK